MVRLGSGEGERTRKRRRTTYAHTFHWNSPGSGPGHLWLLISPHAYYFLHHIILSYPTTATTTTFLSLRFSSSASSLSETLIPSTQINLRLLFSVFYFLFYDLKAFFYLVFLNFFFGLNGGVLGFLIKGVFFCILLISVYRGGEYGGYHWKWGSGIFWKDWGKVGTWVVFMEPWVAWRAKMDRWVIQIPIL
ncbi:hypothetical protein FPQ18DRAFT_313453, partial [Pyronema domesticum]